MQKDDTREALSAFSDVANIYFHEISETADIETFRFGMTDHASMEAKDAVFSVRACYMQMQIFGLQTMMTLIQMPMQLRMICRREQWVR